MADTLMSKVMFTLNYSALETIMSEFDDVEVRKDGIHLITRGFGLHHLLKEITKDNFREVIIAKHSTSQDMYSKLYTVRYKHGRGETLKIETSEPIMKEIDQDELAELLKDLEEQDLNVHEKSLGKKEVNKDLIPALLKASERQRPQKYPEPILKSGQENFELEIAVGKMMYEDIERGYDDTIDVLWICTYINELLYGQLDFNERTSELGIDDFI